MESISFFFGKASREMQTLKLACSFFNYFDALWHLISLELLPILILKFQNAFFKYISINDQIIIKITYQKSEL